MDALLNNKCMQKSRLFLSDDNICLHAWTDWKIGIGRLNGWRRNPFGTSASMPSEYNYTQVVLHKCALMLTVRYFKTAENILLLIRSEVYLNLVVRYILL